MADGDTTLAPPPDDSQLQTPQIVQDQQQTPTAASPPPVAQQKQDAEDPLVSEKPYVNALIKTINDQKHQDEQYMSQSQSMWTDFQKKMSEMQATPAPQLQQTPPAPTTKDKLNWGTAIGDVLSMVAIASTIFGKHRGGYAQAIQMSAVGAFVNGYTQGKEKVAQAGLEQWKEQTSLIEKQNAQQLQVYKETLADKKLTLQEQMDVIKEQAAMTNNARLYQAAATKNLTELVKTIHDMNTAHLAYKKANQDATKHFTSTYYKLPNAAAYRAEVMKRYGIDPAKSDEELQKAEEKYPLDQFNKDFKGGTVEEHEDDILGLKGDKKPTEEDTNKVFSDMGLQ
jgi:hypothetical protein